MKLLWLGDAADTGFGTVTRELGRRLLAAGHDVRFLLQNMTWEPLPEPFASRSWNRDLLQPQSLGRLAADGFQDGWKADATLILADFAAARTIVSWNEEAWAKARNVWHYVPVEGHDLPPLWAKMWQGIAPIAMTRFGADEITKITKRPTPYIYHGVDTDVFHPASPDHPIIGQHREALVSKRDCKISFGLDPDETILLRTDRHMPRKGYNVMLRAIAPVLRERDGVKLVIHCRAQDFGGNLPDTLSKFDGDVLNDIVLTNGHDTWKGIPLNVMAALYNAADVYLNSGSEGFGLAVAEALACGVPVLGVNYSSLPEVVGPAGRLIGYDLVDNIYDHYWAYPKEQPYRTALRKMLYPGEAARLGALGPEHVKRFNWDEAAPLFVALFESTAAAAA